MYTPATFKVTDSAVLTEAIRANSFGVLVAQDGTGFEATHIPMQLNETDGDNGTLSGHLARPNPLWELADGKRVLAVFSGPHAYISPTWLGEPNLVPTWNFVAVHVTGTFRAIHEPSKILDIVNRSVDTYEAALPTPWRNELDEKVTSKLVNAIVGFTIEIDKIEGKWKLSQNRSKAAVERAAAILGEFDDDNARQTATLMRNPPTAK